MLLLTLLSSVLANALSDTQTSYIGANMLEGEVDITFDAASSVNPAENPNSYSYFVGNTLYVGNEDSEGNSVDAIMEFFWFQSSIDRGSDFYVGIIKARSTPAMGQELYVGDWNDWDTQPVLSVEALSEDTRGAFRWEWSVPFESYGIDAYGQIQVGHQVGFGATAQGSAMTHGELPEGTNINGIPIAAEGDIQAKGFIGSDYKIQTQYDITLYEWDVYVNGRGDMMAWDTYLNLGARADQSAYHEYFLIVQVDEGETFNIEEINVLGNFDNSGWGDLNPWGNSEVGVTLSGLQISAPFYEAPEEEEDWTWEPSYEPSSEPAYEPSSEPSDEVVEQPEDSQDGDPGFEEVDLPEISNPNDSQEPVVSGCSTAGGMGTTGIALALVSLLVSSGRRKEQE
ncbi:MAG: hypothetical protein CL916_13270 [Deltaproteobacteria bacterium]|nr:hypothetical protein [Deltaproteobacteria bacterium]